MQVESHTRILSIPLTITPNQMIIYSICPHSITNNFRSLLLYPFPDFLYSYSPYPFDYLALFLLSTCPNHLNLSFSRSCLLHLKFLLYAHSIRSSRTTLCILNSVTIISTLWFLLIVRHSDPIHRCWPQSYKTFFSHF